MVNNKHLATFLTSIRHGSHFRVDLVIYCLLLFATVAFSRDFTWLHVRLSLEAPYIQLFTRSLEADSFALQLKSPGVPVFVTEVFLALLLGCIFISVIREKNENLLISWTWLDKAVALWLVVGFFDLARGLSTSPLLALRDFAIIYYVIFFYIAGKVCSCYRDFVCVMMVFFVGTLVSLGVSVYNYLFNINFWPGQGVDWPAVGQFMPGNYGVYFLVTILTGTSAWQLMSGKSKGLLWSYLSLATFALALAQQRSLVIAFVSGLLILFVGSKVFDTIKPMPLWRLAVGVTVAGLLLGVVRLSLGTPTEFFGPIKQLVLKSATTVKTADTKQYADGKGSSVGASVEKKIELTGTARFRQDAWEEAWRRFRHNPIFGEGFGKTFVFYDAGLKKWWTQDVRPHNTYLTILYKMGVFGLAAFAIIHLLFYRIVYQGLRENFQAAVKTNILVLTSALVAFQVYGFFNLLMESPYLGMVYWSLMGVILSLVRFGKNLSPSVRENVEVRA